ncbi:lipoate--protein ligase family protein [Pseudoclavibacter chungangensis]|uniref:Lipoate--protein ligase family protein n=1 Tax=Pseudoclavibacter chungangensis TaxID=587635 RepID=A0A7J5BQW7_9MICO|nr:biotin/lipoate A/B protein ligase family protein [Pseudoclavibacter chungangensis]KAB1653834.1 lipoate--protein ligase family protein [Pseudoclavibacter chungangensis]NYJ68155.1 lipoate-protein ligase A [Pseudoclavibacter chungangensis]
MHGEFKVPGGKLVVVDVDAVDGILTNTRVAGDFFLEPDEALDDINAAVDGLPLESTAEEIAAAVTAGLRPDAHLLGFSPEAIGVVVRRATTRARDWRELDWQILETGPLEPRVHVALDQVLTEEVGAGRRKPTLRFWRDWDRTAVIIGSFQSVRNEVDLENAEKYDVDVIRRITGGGAMFMEAGSIVTYSLYVPAELVQGMSFAESYAFLDEWVLDGLHSIGVDAVYQPLNDIASPSGKIGGAAQKRLGSGAVLHHATLSYDIDADRMVEVLRIGREKLSDKGTTSAKKRVSPLKTQTGLPREEIIDRLEATFVSEHGGTRVHATDEELARARELADSKFASKEWTFRVP